MIQQTGLANFRKKTSESSNTAVHFPQMFLEGEDLAFWARFKEGMSYVQERNLYPI